MNEVTLYTVESSSALTVNPDEIRLLDARDMPTRIYDDGCLLAHAYVDVESLQVHRISNVFAGSESQNLIAFKPGFSELLLNEVMEDEKKALVDRERRKASNAIALGKDSLMRELELQNTISFAGWTKRLKYLFTGKLER